MAARANVACPNCGSPLYTGHDGVTGDNIAVCRDNSNPPNGCQAAWDLKAIEAGTAPPPGPWDVEAAPVLGPAGEAEIHAEPPQVTPDPDPTKEPFEGPVPTSVPVTELSEEEAARVTDATTPTPPTAPQQ